MSKLSEGAFLTSINERECTAVLRRSVITINHGTTKTACAASASIFNFQVDQQPSSSATSTGSASSTSVAEDLTSMLVAEDVSDSTPANATPKLASPSSSVATPVPSRSAAASFASNSSQTSTTPVTSTASLPAPLSTTTVSLISIISPLSASISATTSTSTAITPQQQPAQLIEESSSVTVSTSEATAREPTSTTERVQAPSVEATQGQEPKERLSTSASAKPVPAESSAPASVPPVQPTRGTKIDSQNGSPSPGPAPLPTDAASSSSRIGDGVLPTRTTLETLASAATPGTPADGTSAVSSITTIELSSTTLGYPFGQNHPQSSKPVGERPGGSGNSGNNPQDVTPAADNSNQSSHGLSRGGMVGIAVGGFAALSLITLLLWLWRGRVAKKRGDALPSSFSKATRKERDVDENELEGGAARARTGTARLAAVLGFHGGRSRSPGGPFDSPRVNLNRGHSQFLETAAVPRHDSSTATHPVSNVLAVKDRVLGWWSRKADNKDFNARVPPTADMAEKSSTYNTRPEFRTGLGINFNGSGRFDPFSDAEAISSNAVYSSQPTNAKPSNPFADPRSQNASATYAPAIPPRFHGLSLSATVRTSQYRPPSMASRPHSIHRDSLQSVDSFVDRRNKFRSDPFDLELQGRLVPSSTAVSQMPRHTAASSIYSAHTRPGSLSSSRYTSGVSVGDWSEAGAVPAPGRKCDSPPPAEAPRPGEKTPPSGSRNVESMGMVFGQAL
ncbi:hypothetical protein TOPH_02118 [Tolypocladium ophioglossoides CBS 100239]|uniref:Uncharacterized protein n=1 Tax=Tolypocladium ophioglossoides (strain CBS 100239) TaxID=1163406 RepID=A0A0L0NGD4_TOLOC|nr:hypothetical protein TOPH_02118 [Tolypocladium ophioglossoides CBS 100239]